MNAIVKISGKQYKVSKGDIFKVHRQEWKIGDKVKLDNILMTDNNGKIAIGNPVVKGASVTVKILDHNRDKKILIYKKNGHRQGVTLLEVVKIDAKSPAKPKKKEEK